MAYAFRPLSPDDMAKVTRIYNHYVEHTTVSFHIAPRTEAEVGAMLIYPGGPFGSYALEEEEQLIGYCALVPFSSREAYDITAELSLYLRPEARGRGYGQAMLDFLEKEAGDKGFISLMARVCTQNTASIGLFEKNGYKRAGDYEKVGRKFGQILDVVAYQKIIGQR